MHVVFIASFLVACSFGLQHNRLEEDADCSSLGEWSTTPFRSDIHGWSRMGYAFHQGAGQPCSSDIFWGDGKGMCYYAACPVGSETNLDERTAPGYDRADRWPSLCPCKRVERDASHLFEAGPEENVSSTGIVTVVSDSNVSEDASQTDAAAEASTETPNTTVAEAYVGPVDSNPSFGGDNDLSNSSDDACGGCPNTTYFDAEITCSVIEQLSQFSSCVSEFCARCGSHSILTSSDSTPTDWEDWTKPTIECAMQGDPQISNFDGVNVPLEAEATTKAELSHGGDVVKWIVKSSSVRIQALYTSEDGHVRLPYVRAVAVSGSFLNGSVLIVGRARDPVTWNTRSILKDMPSQYVIPRQVRARRDSLATVRDRSKKARGMEFVFPSSVRLLVSRQPSHVNFAIRMTAEAGQDGLCGNFNGDGHDDNLNTLGKRGALSVKPQESLFSDWLPMAAERVKQRQRRAAP